MKISELLETTSMDENVVFGRQKGKSKFATRQKPMFRCASGPRQGKRVSSLTQCVQSVNPEKIRQMTLTRAKTGVRQARKAKRTKKVDPASRAASANNRRRSRS